MPPTPSMSATALRASASGWGSLEDVHRSEGEEIGLRVFVGKRNATVASSDLSNEALETLVERALAMAAEAPEDQFAGLAPEELLFRGAPPTSTSTMAAIRIPPTSGNGRWLPKMPRAPSKA